MLIEDSELYALRLLYSSIRSFHENQMKKLINKSWSKDEKKQLIDFIGQSLKALEQAINRISDIQHMFLSAHAIIISLLKNSNGELRIPAKEDVLKGNHELKFDVDHSTGETVIRLYEHPTQLH